MNDLSKILCERSRPTEAIEILEEIIPIVQRTLGEQYAGMAMTQSNLARAYAMSNDHCKAEKVLAKLLPSIPPEHPDYIHTMFGYLRVRIELGKFQEAEKDCLNVLDRISKFKIIPLNDPRTIAIAEELHAIYQKQ